MYVIELAVSNQSIEVSRVLQDDRVIPCNKLLTVNGTVGIIVCRFLFDETWDDYPARLGIFANENDVEPKESPILVNECIVPPEILKYKGTIRMALKGTNTDGKTQRTRTISVIEQLQTLQGGSNSIEPTPDQFTLFVDAVENEVKKVTDMSVSAETLEPTEEARVTKSIVEGVVHLLFGIPQGIQGIQGIQGETGNGILSAFLNQNYTLTLNFTDGSSYTTPSIRGEKGNKGDNGDDYVITEADYEAIADVVIERINRTPLYPRGGVGENV